MPTVSSKKLILNGHILELYEYEKPVYSDFEGQGGRKKKKSDIDSLTTEEEKFLQEIGWLTTESGESDREEENRNLTLKRARNNIRRLAVANFNNHSKFLTLTFAKNETDIKSANIHFKAFIRKLKHELGTKEVIRWIDEKTGKNRKRTVVTPFDLKYIAVLEFQKRGAIHYHIMCNIPYTHFSILNRLWTYGSTHIEDITEVDNVGAYLVKYMFKDLKNDTALADRLKGEMCYLCSKGLTRPIEVRGEYADNLIEFYKLNEKQDNMVFTNHYPSEHFGLITYKEYNLKQTKLGKDKRAKKEQKKITQKGQLEKEIV